jgi:hypothetical protein
MLCAGGVLTAVFAGSSLRLAIGVLAALAGFELIYARIDPGLLITGGLAVFQMTFALVASLFLGPAPPESAPAGSEPPRSPG